MGTRADFYICDDLNDPSSFEWLGSTAYDGYPCSDNELLRAATTERIFLEQLHRYVSDRDDFTDPAKHGWPWPWEDSRTTDYAYAFERSRSAVFASCFGHSWYSALESEPEDSPKDARFPDMSSRSEPAIGTSRDSIMIVKVPG